MQLKLLLLLLLRFPSQDSRLSSQPWSRQEVYIQSGRRICSGQLTSLTLSWTCLLGFNSTKHVHKITLSILHLFGLDSTQQDHSYFLVSTWFGFNQTSTQDHSYCLVPTWSSRLICKVKCQSLNDCLLFEWFGFNQISTKITHTVLCLLYHASINHWMAASCLHGLD